MKKWKWDDVTEGGLRGRRANLESVIWEGIYLGGRGDLSCDLKDKEPVLPRSASSASVSVVREDKAFQAVGTAVTESRGEQVWCDQGRPQAGLNGTSDERTLERRAGTGSCRTVGLVRVLDLF